MVESRLGTCNCTIWDAASLLMVVARAPLGVRGGS